MSKILPIVAMLVIASGLFFVFSMKDPASPSTTNTNSPTPSALNPHINALRAGGSSYLDPAGRYSLLYPNDYILDTEDSKHIRIYKRAETERPQSELSDGALMVFESVDLGTQSLEQWVDTRIQESTADGTSEVIKTKSATILNNFPGFTYELRSLGNATHLVLQKSVQSPFAVVITYTVSDPKGNDYQSELEAILSTFEVIK